MLICFQLLKETQSLMTKAKAAIMEEVKAKGKGKFGEVLYVVDVPAIEHRNHLEGEV